MSLNSGIEGILKEYLEQKEKSLLLIKKRNDSEKEYNKLLATLSGEDKVYNLTQADQIYKAYQDMLVFEEQAKAAEAQFIHVENRLKEVGRILFEGTIMAQVEVPSNNGTPSNTKQVTVSYQNGQVVVR